MSQEEFWKGISDEGLLTWAASPATGQATQAIAGALVRLKNAVVEQQESTNRLTEKIRRLNVGLLWFTVAVFILTAAQVATSPPGSSWSADPADATG